jgi:HD-GYP domain-containing protein (c-di-GMP phosphodiesterase class II)
MALEARRTRAAMHPTSSRSRTRAELEALHATALEALERRELSSVLERVVTRAGELLGTSDAFLYLRDEADEQLVIRAGTGVFRAKVGHGVRGGEDVAGGVWETGEPITIADYRAWPERRGHYAALAVRTVVAVPLLAGDDTAGVLGLSYPEVGRTVGPPQLGLLERFAEIVALAVENARLSTAAEDELLERRRAEEELLEAIASLKRSEHELQRAHAETIRRLASAAEYRDDDTGRHIERMGRYCEFLARRLGLEEARCELLRIASPLHDVGKIAIPDAILLKPGPLSVEERRLMERHAEVGYELLSGSSSELLEVAATIAWTHHERVDGGGYPRGLVGAEIPLEGRIASVADVFEALTSDRVYRPAFTVREALELMRRERGTHFDAVILDVLVESVHELTHAAGIDAPSDGRPTVSASRARPSETEGLFPVERLRDAANAAKAALDTVSDDRTAVELMVSRLHQEAGCGLLVAVYLAAHGRLWCVAHRGYEEARDGLVLKHGVMGRALRSGEPQLVEDVTTDPDFIGAHGEAFSELALPFGDRSARGVLNLEVSLTLPEVAVSLFTPLLEPLARRVAGLEQEIGPQTEALLRLCVQANSMRGVEAIAEFATQTVGRLLQLDMAQLDIAAGDSYRLASFWGRDGSPTAPLRADELRALEREWEPGHAAFSLLEPGGGTNQLVWLPLRAADAMVGVIVGVAAGEVSHARIEAATLFCQHVAALVHGATALRREERVAVTDLPTGLLNRRGFVRRLREELAHAKRAGYEVTLVVFALDGLRASGGDRDLAPVLEQRRDEPHLLGKLPVHLSLHAPRGPSAVSRLASKACLEHVAMPGHVKASAVDRFERNRRRLTARHRGFASAALARARSPRARSPRSRSPPLLRSRGSRAGRGHTPSAPFES